MKNAIYSGTFIVLQFLCRIKGREWSYIRRVESIFFLVDYLMVQKWMKQVFSNNEIEAVCSRRILDEFRGWI
jgi:hypothetical protein